jgi:integrase
MPDNLVRWLLPYRQTTGPVSPSAVTIRRGRKAILDAAKLPSHWPQDVLRHSFATHWMAAYSHEGRLAEMLGNSPAIFERHYKGLATAIEGAKFFKIEPPAVRNVIQMQAVA